nr:vespryn [Pogona vitticeps]
MQTGSVLQKFRGLCCITWLLLCLLAQYENGGKVLALSSSAKPYKTSVTFDPKTAHPNLVVSQDKKTVTWVQEAQSVPDNPERFNSTPCLLGSPGFTSGKHYWEVEYGNQRELAAGVARKSVKRKDHLRLTPEEGIWQVGRWWLRRGGPENQSDSGKIGVLLDYGRNQVTFYMDNKVTVVRASFNGEEVFPFCYVGSTVSLRLNP